METGMQQSVEQVFQELISTNHPETISLLASINHSLHQNKLHTRYSVSEIVNEVYCRAYRACKRKEYIFNPRAWIRATSYNVIQEYRRREAKQIPVEPHYLDLFVADSWEETYAVDTQAISEALTQCCNMLNAEQQLMLRLRLWNNLSWEQVSEYLIQAGYKERRTATLRKAYERLLKRLRKEIHKILPADSLMQ
jgi:DNA-directed RNA polymerase specialized sigma24 family protein